MKRSDINAIMADAKSFIESFGFKLPPFAEWSPADMQARRQHITDLKSGEGMCYAEKIMISRDKQLSPMHRHIVKAEDIINRGGGVLALELFNSDDDGNIDTTTDVTVATDGVLRTQGPGDILKLYPGESVTLLPGNWHAFWGEEGDVLIGEVSTVNDDLTDNVFREAIGRFSEVEEVRPANKSN